jgi:ABC-type phosphate transport system substrate-binding protein
MRYSFGGSAGAFAAAAALTLSYTQAAHAAECKTLPNPVYVAGSSAVKPFLAQVAAKLRQATPAITVAYVGKGSCDGPAYMAKPSDDPASQLTATTLTIFDNDGKDIAGGCDVGATDSVAVDIGVSDVYASSCSKTVNSDVGDFHGPVQTMTFVVHPESTATSISAEAAYLIYGFGAASNKVAPWNDPTAIWQRGAASGTQSMIAVSIKVPPAKWLPAGAANVTAGSSGMLTNVSGAKTAGKTNQTIGVLATDLTDAGDNRNKVRILAYQHYGQSCGYLPDSTPTSFDKANVRDGHYFIWGPLHMYARKGSDGRPSSEDAKKVIEVLEGSTELEGVDLVKIEAKGGVVPMCAMKVNRDDDAGAFYSYQPPKMCGCKYDYETVGSTDCTACTTANADTVCPTGKKACNYGYCEVK